MRVTPWKWLRQANDPAQLAALGQPDKRSRDRTISDKTTGRQTGCGSAAAGSLDPGASAVLLLRPRVDVDLI